MDLIDLYNISEKEKINIVNIKLKDTTGMFIRYKKINIVALDYSNIDNTNEEKCILSEELAHYYMDATYPASCTEKDNILIEKQEYRAKKWSYYTLIPFEKLKLAILNRN